MNDGRWAQVAPELYDRPSSRFVAGFIANRLHARGRTWHRGRRRGGRCEGVLTAPSAPAGRPAAPRDADHAARALRFADGAWNGNAPQNRLSVTVTRPCLPASAARYMLRASDGTSWC